MHAAVDKVVDLPAVPCVQEERRSLDCGHSQPLLPVMMEFVEPTAGAVDKSYG